MKKRQMELNIIGSKENHDLEFWLQKSPEERISAVEFLRTQYYTISGYKSIPRIELVIQIKRRDP